MGSPAKVKRKLTSSELNDLPNFWQNYTKLLEQYK